MKEVANVPVHKTLNNGHLCLLELLLSITTGGVGEVDGVTDLDVIGEGNVLYLNTKRAIVRLRYFQKRKWIHALLSIPLSKELNVLAKARDVRGECSYSRHVVLLGLYLYQKNAIKSTKVSVISSRTVLS